MIDVADADKQGQVEVERIVTSSCVTKRDYHDTELLNGLGWPPQTAALANSGFSVILAAKWQSNHSA